MESLRTNINQICSDFRDIKDAIVSSGVEVADGTKTSEYAGKVSEVYEQGKKSQYDEFWDNYQDYGNRTNYEGAFSGLTGWNNVTFVPKYPIKPTQDKVFRMFSGNTQITDFSKYDIDFSGVTGSFNQVFWGTTPHKIGIIDLSNASGLDNCFQYCQVVTIEKIILKEDGSQTIVSNAFLHMREIQNIAFEGKIGVSFGMPQSSKLTYESLTSIINALKDYSGTTSTYTLTLHTDAKAKLTESDIATITQKGWTLA